MLDQSVCHKSTKLQQRETEIRTVFTRHITALCHQKWQIVDDITKWSLTLTNQIQDYVKEQRKLLDDAYEQKVAHLNTLRDSILEKMMKNVKKHDNHQVEQLLTQCSALKLELVTLTYMDRPISTIKLTVDIIEKQNDVDKSNANTTKAEPNPQVSNFDHGNSTKDNIDANEYQTPVTISINTETTSSSNEIKTPAEIPQISNNVAPSRNTSRSEYDDSSEKCPLCYMIFPPNMTIQNRSLHINDHY